MKHTNVAAAVSTEAPVDAPEVSAQFEKAAPAKFRANYFFAITNEDADRAVDAMIGKGYGGHGMSCTGPAYVEGARNDYVHMFILHGPVDQVRYMMHGTVLEHVLKRTDIDDDLRKELKEALSFYTAIAPVSCWGAANHPHLRGKEEKPATPGMP